MALGARIEEREGSRVLVRLFDERRVFHRPHPSPMTASSLDEVKRNRGIRFDYFLFHSVASQKSLIIESDSVIRLVT